MEKSKGKKIARRDILKTVDLTHLATTKSGFVMGFLLPGVHPEMR